uniref:Uncharacterized protein n=1 Tax=Trichuris muris TaxID=70415 RepID=A0A5S6QGW3_TRIMR
MKIVFILSIACLACSFAAESDESAMERIERILKPSAADEFMKAELQRRINKSEEVCKKGKCKALHESLINGTETDKFNDTMKQYDACMEPCRKPMAREFDLLSEIGRKEDYWKNLTEVKEKMSLHDAVIYWTEIKEDFKNLEEEETQYELIQTTIRLTEEGQKQLEELESEIRKQDSICENEECDTLRRALLFQIEVTEAASRALQYSECMKKCKQVVAHEVMKAEELKSNEDCSKNMERIRKHMSVLHAVTYYELNKGSLA